MTRIYRQADHVFMARIDEDVVILDVAADAYMSLAGAGEVVQPSLDGRIDIFDPELADALLDAGLTTTAPPPRPRRVAAPAQAALPCLEPAAVPAVAAAGLRLAWAAFVFRRRSLRQLTAPRPAADVPPRRRAARTLPRLAARVSACQAALPWIPGEGECLQRAFALREALRPSGAPIDWVFGVRTWPFAAHCWLQVEDRVVADTPERITNYTPIMVV